VVRVLLAAPCPGRLEVEVAVVHEVDEPTGRHKRGRIAQVQHAEITSAPQDLPSAAREVKTPLAEVVGDLLLKGRELTLLPPAEAWCSALAEL
jgi:hypothetical protein